MEYGRLSSVVDHNLFSFKHLATVPYYQVGALNTTIYLVPGSTLLASRFKPDNLMHLLHDDILPLFVTIRQLGIESSLGRLFFDDNWNHTVGWHLLDALFPGSLTKLNFPKSASDSMICFEKAFIGKQQRSRPSFMSYLILLPMEAFQMPPFGTSMDSYSRKVPSREQPKN